MYIFILIYNESNGFTMADLQTGDSRFKKKNRIFITIIYLAITGTELYQFK